MVPSEPPFLGQASPNLPRAASYFSNTPASESLRSGPNDKKPSRAPPPPIPGAVPPGSPLAQGRVPPPPPPSAAPPASRDVEEGESDYEGDYDTDIASGDNHKAALTRPTARELRRYKLSGQLTYINCSELLSEGIDYGRHIESDKM